MEFVDNAQPYEDNRDVTESFQSMRSLKNDSLASSVASQNHDKNFLDKNRVEDEKESRATDSRAKTRTDSDPDRDRMSDKERRGSSGTLYSDDYENESPSERSISPYARSHTPCRSTRKGLRAKRAPGSPYHKTGVIGTRGPSRLKRPGVPHHPMLHRRGPRSQSKDSTQSKDVDLVTKQVLSARLLKINELRNALSELQMRNDELKKENRVLRQLQFRHEKALHRYDDTENEITQLISRHNNETHVLRERLRRTQERERAAERRLKDCEEQLRRSKADVGRLKKLVEQRELGAREALSRKLEEEKTRVEEAERKIKELERNMELSNGSLQRQLTAERKKTLSGQEEIRALREELEQVSGKLKKKERELDTKNIYANSLAKLSPRKDTDSFTKQKAVSFKSSTKAVQTEDGQLYLDFPPPPPAIANGNEDEGCAAHDYLSFKELNGGAAEAERPRARESEKERRQSKEPEKDESEDKKQPGRERDGSAGEKTWSSLRRSVKANGDKAAKGSAKEKEEADSLRSQKEEENNRKAEQAAEEARRKKEQLLAKMSEIDRQREDVFASPVNSTLAAEISAPEQRSGNVNIFSLTEPEEAAGGVRPGSGRKRTDAVEGGGMGRRGGRGLLPTDDLAFGGYAPSFGRSSSRSSSGLSQPPTKDDKAPETFGVFNLGGGKEKEKDATDKKYSLMQQLFGAAAAATSTSTGTAAPSGSTVDILGGPPAATANGGRSRRESQMNFSSTSSSPPTSCGQAADSRPGVRAITSNPSSSDIEELAL